MKSEINTQLTTSRWTRATFWGWLLGVGVIVVLSSALDAAGIENMQFYLGAGIGSGVGLAQWILLRKHFAGVKNWIWSSALGMGIPFIALDFVMTDNTSYKLLVGIGLGGITTGVLQAIILRNYFQKTFLWAISCFTGWVLAALAVLSVNYTMTIRTTGSLNLVVALLNLLLILSGGLILGMTSGMTFKKMEKI